MWIIWCLLYVTCYAVLVVCWVLQVVEVEIDNIVGDVPAPKSSRSDFSLSVAATTADRSSTVVKSESDSVNTKQTVSSHSAVSSLVHSTSANIYSTVVVKQEVEMSSHDQQIELVSNRECHRGNSCEADCEVDGVQVKQEPASPVTTMTCHMSTSPVTTMTCYMPRSPVTRGTCHMSRSPVTTMTCHLPTSPVTSLTCHMSTSPVISPVTSRTCHMSTSPVTRVTCHMSTSPVTRGTCYMSTSPVTSGTCHMSTSPVTSGTCHMSTSPITSVTCDMPRSPVTRGTCHMSTSPVIRVTCHTSDSGKSDLSSSSSDLASTVPSVTSLTTDASAEMNVGTRADKVTVVQVKQEPTSPVTSIMCHMSTRPVSTSMTCHMSTSPFTRMTCHTSDSGECDSVLNTLNMF